MRITFIGHASILIETQGLRILSDPWWRGPCFGAQWWTYPTPYLDPLQAPVDFIYISHGHHDHFHPGTLKTLDRRPTVLVSKNIDLAHSVAELGFKVVGIADDEAHSLGAGVTCRIIETHAADTLFAIDDGSSVCVNLNDALHAAPDDVQEQFIGALKALYPRIDYVFCGYGVASHFPNCYRIPGKDARATAAMRQAYFNRRWVKIVSGLEPRFAFPFAADVALLEEDLIWANEPTHNAERPTAVFALEHPESHTTTADIAPGFEIANGSITREILRKPTSLERLRSECSEGIARANTYGAASDETWQEVYQLVEQNLKRCERYLQEYRGDYRFLLRFRNHLRGIAVEKAGSEIKIMPHPLADEGGFDLIYRTRVHYLKASLATPYGNEILFVGSGGIFEYSERSRACKNLHRELMVLLTPHDTCPASRFGRSSPLVHRLKRVVKRLLGRRSEDLYDLERWTVWAGEPKRSLSQLLEAR